MPQPIKLSNSRTTSIQQISASLSPMMLFSAIFQTDIVLNRMTVSILLSEAKALLELFCQIT